MQRAKVGTRRAMKAASRVTPVLGLLLVVSSCKKTADGEYQVQVPKLEVKKDTATVRTPTVEVVKETTTMVVPKVKVKKPPRDTTRP